MKNAIFLGLSVVLVFAEISLALEPVESVGKWLEVEAGKGTVMKWQASDLTLDPHRPNCLWAIADQNGTAQLAGSNVAIGPAKHVFMIDIPTNANAHSVTVRPFEIRFTPEDFKAVKGLIDATEWKLGLDFEGFVADPVTANIFYACTEGSIPLLMKLSFDGTQMHVSRVVRISSRLKQDDADDSDINKRWEGLTINKTGTRLFLAAERQIDDAKPRLYTLMVNDFDKAPSLANDPHSEVLPRALKEVQLPGTQISGLQYLPNVRDPNHPGFLLALNRNPEEKIYVVDLAYLRLEPRVVRLDLYAPGDHGGKKFKTKGMSPEGIAVDSKTDRVWLINDPLAKYYAVPAGDGNHRFKDEVPMLFDFSLKSIIP